MPTTLIVIENKSDWAPYFNSDMVITFEQYLSHNYPVIHSNNNEKSKASRFRIINLCKNQSYLSVGYYCSLLAEARGHSVIPSIRTLNDLSQRELMDLELNHLSTVLFSQKAVSWQIPASLPLMNVSIVSFFGKTSLPQYAEFACKVFEYFPVPILRIKLNYKSSWEIQHIEVAGTDSLSESEETEFADALDEFSSNIWRKKKADKTYKFEVAILVDPEEKLPPSDKKAIKKFIAAGKSLNIHCELITKNDYLRLPEYDGLFIRTTTAIDNYSYRFAKKAEAEGLVVIDDSTSILHCTNKIFLSDLFNENSVKAPKTELLRDSEDLTTDHLATTLGYPIVLKIPDGAFSVGVEKVKNQEELNEVLQRLFKRSSLILAQEYLYTAFDWRIGVLNNKVIYACRYHMVQNHWQIYQHGVSRVSSGGFETLPTFEVPKYVLDVALKATKLIGNGLYGVDIKEANNQGYVIEINDNPSIDSGVEDLYLGDELYRIIMSEFLRRIELRGNPQ